MSIISPTTCGFAKVAAFSLVNTKSWVQRINRNEDITHHFAEFNEHFIGYNENFNIKYRTFQDYLGHTKLISWFSSATDRKVGADSLFFYILYVKLNLPTDSKIQSFIRF